MTTTDNKFINTICKSQGHTACHWFHVHSTIYIYIYIAIYVLCESIKIAVLSTDVLRHKGGGEGVWLGWSVKREYRVRHLATFGAISSAFWMISFYSQGIWSQWWPPILERKCLNLRSTLCLLTSYIRDLKRNWHLTDKLNSWRPSDAYMHHWTSHHCLIYCLSPGRR